MRANSRTSCSDFGTRNEGTPPTRSAVLQRADRGHNVPNRCLAERRCFAGGSRGRFVPDMLHRSPDAKRLGLEDPQPPNVSDPSLGDGILYRPDVNLDVCTRDLAQIDHLKGPASRDIRGRTVVTANARRFTRTCDVSPGRLGAFCGLLRQNPVLGGAQPVIVARSGAPPAPRPPA